MSISKEVRRTSCLVAPGWRVAATGGQMKCTKINPRRGCPRKRKIVYCCHYLWPVQKGLLISCSLSFKPGTANIHEQNIYTRITEPKSLNNGRPGRCGQSPAAGSRGFYRSVDGKKAEPSEQIKFSSWSDDSREKRSKFYIAN